MGMAREGEGMGKVEEGEVLAGDAGVGEVGVGEVGVGEEVAGIGDKRGLEDEVVFTIGEARGSEGEGMREAVLSLIKTGENEVEGVARGDGEGLRGGLKELFLGEVERGAN